jgi:hypothetical protein
MVSSLVLESLLITLSSRANELRRPCLSFHEQSLIPRAYSLLTHAFAGFLTRIHVLILNCPAFPRRLTGATLTASLRTLFQHHDRTRIKVYVYYAHVDTMTATRNVGPPPSLTKTWAKLQAAADVFTDVRNMTDVVAIAETMIIAHRYANHPNI